MYLCAEGAQVRIGGNGGFPLGSEGVPKAFLHNPVVPKVPKAHSRSYPKGQSFRRRFSPKVDQKLSKGIMIHEKGVLYLAVRIVRKTA